VALGMRFTATPPETLTDPEGSAVSDGKLHRCRHWLLLMPDIVRPSSTPVGLHCFHYTNYCFTKPYGQTSLLFSRFLVHVLSCSRCLSQMQEITTR
jgi:hypothetical protein